MKVWKQKLLWLAALLGMLIVTGEVAARVFQNNFEAGLYPPEADSYSMALFTGYLVSFLAFIMTAIGISLPNTRLWGLVGLLPIVLSSLVMLSSASEWLIRDHYLISLAYLIDVACLLGMIYWGWIKRKINIGDSR